MPKYVKYLDPRKPLEELSIVKLLVIARNMRGISPVQNLEILLMNKAHLCRFIRAHGGVPADNR
jgi:hypothetical protein